MTGIPLGAGGEFDRIRAISVALGSTIGPIGDDTATISEANGALVVSVDASVEDVHFRRAWLSFEEIGWRATASALSDLAAAAATPVGVLAAVVVPRDAPPDALIDVMQGVGAASASVGATVVGGDLSSGPVWSVVITVFGRAVDRMSRAGAAAGDGIWVTGALGGARAALEAWKAGNTPDAVSRESFAHPRPRIDAARWLAANGATAMMDLSDGVGGDAQHLAAASAVSLEIELERVPLHTAVAAAARAVNEAPAFFAAVAGEDYELLVTLPAAFDGAGAFHRDNGLALTRIGTVAPGAGVRATLNGVLHAIRGYQHEV